MNGYKEEARKENVLTFMEDLDGDEERGFDCLTFVLVSSKAYREGCRALRGGFPYWLPIPSFICKVLNYFKVHISRFNPFDMVKLTTFIVMSKAYGGEPTVDLLRSFLNLGLASDWLTLSNRGSANVLKALLKPITHLGNWKDIFFFIENKIISYDYPELLLGENKSDKKSLKDKFPLLPEVDPLYDQLTMSFMLEWVDGEFDFLPAKGVSEARELNKDRDYAELERKCNEALQDLDKNPLVSYMRVEIKVLQGQVDGLHKVAAMKDPFVLEKMSGYRPLSKEEYDQAGDALANASYPFLAEYVINPYASVE
uniref:Transposase (putative) gypsy type domain-containing protein n=1 Tax=Tanacetum cinerariifolium TaxID=118510 RepID=A0A6L2M2K8_TANCI|nr:hypothetical protein [Tanacetum cinerariifolium]